jgi:uncharacterized protein YndB with AHSA1/START domain
MPDILHDFPIDVSPARVYDAVATPKGLDEWWTSKSAGKPQVGNEYQLGFGPKYDWRAKVTRAEPGKSFELEITRSDEDWNGTRVGFELEGSGTSTQVRFHHTGWPKNNDHYRISCYCWAMYLRVMKRNLEFGERVPYEDRLNV